MSCTVAVIVPPTNKTPAVLRVTVDGDTNLYLTCECACDVPGHRLFDVVSYKARERGHAKAVIRYSTLVCQPQPNTPPRGSCDCPGGTYDRVETCRHVNFIAAMWQNGYL